MDRREFGLYTIAAISGVCAAPTLSFGTGTRCDLKLFRTRLPDAFAFIEFGSNKRYGIHACYWRPGSFTSHREFTRFTLGFSSILQAYITRPHLDQIEDWFRFDDDLDARLARKWSKDTVKMVDVDTWTQENYPGATIPWLQSGGFTQTLTAFDDDCVEVFAVGRRGFHHAFTADAIF